MLTFNHPFIISLCSITSTPSISLFSVDEFNNFFSGLNQELPKILPQINQIITRLNQATSNRAGTSADTITNLNRALSNVSEAARSVRNLADYLEQHPEAVLKGKHGGN